MNKDWTKLPTDDKEETSYSSYPPRKIIPKNDFKVPPPFVECECHNGKIRLHPGQEMSNGNKWLGAGDITDICPHCKGSLIPGLKPQFYTPEQYRDWIREENNLPDFELPDNTIVLHRWIESKKWSCDFKSDIIWDDYHHPEKIIIVASIAGKPGTNGL